MQRVIISKDKISGLLDTIKSEYRIVAPVKQNGILEFKEVKDSLQVELTDEISYKSPKEFLFPQCEKFLSFTQNGEVNSESCAVKTILFGVKPCDLGALKVMTAVFTKGKFVDTVYTNHLENTIIIGMGCVNEKPGCFCSERNINKSFSSDCDIFLIDCCDNYSLEALTEKGRFLVDKFLPGQKKYHEPTVSTIQLGNDTQVLELDADENTLFSKIDWERISETCLGCGTCTYICPTCHCFEFKDVKDKGVTSRYRCWDSCMFPKFTLHTSGHNPRSSVKERYRQRILHKYHYVKQNFGYTACTGCGRCIRSCPAGMNIRMVVKNIMEELT